MSEVPTTNHEQPLQTCSPCNPHGSYTALSSGADCLLAASALMLAAPLKATMLGALGLIFEGVSLHHMATRWCSMSSSSACSRLERPKNTGRECLLLSPCAPISNSHLHSRHGRTPSHLSVDSLPLPPLSQMVPQMYWQQKSLKHSVLTKSDTSENGV